MGSVICPFVLVKLNEVPSVLSSFADILMEEREGERERAGCFTFIVFLISCDFKCTVILPLLYRGWSAVCSCGISWSYSLGLHSEFYILLTDA